MLQEDFEREHLKDQIYLLEFKKELEKEFYREPASIQILNIEYDNNTKSVPGITQEGILS
jgi:hypothetical protein